MKCFIIVFDDIFELENFKSFLNAKDGIAEINYEGKVVRFLIYEQEFFQKTFLEVDKIRKENKLSGILVLSIGFDLEKFIRNAKLLNYEVFVLKMKEILVPNNEVAFEYRARNFNEILGLLISL